MLDVSGWSLHDVITGTAYPPRYTIAETESAPAEADTPESAQPATLPYRISQISSVI
ncbi:MAG: hypothetical protein K2I26_03810 [Paramuribaculum sp.]|nr:hypothetical protein [Paramuribaculum sp.]